MSHQPWPDRTVEQSHRSTRSTRSRLWHSHISTLSELRTMSRGCQIPIESCMSSGERCGMRLLTARAASRCRSHLEIVTCYILLSDSHRIAM